MSDTTPTLDKAKLWLSETFDEETRKKVQTLIDSESPDLEDSFYRELEFGTGGMRGRGLFDHARGSI